MGESYFDAITSIADATAAKQDQLTAGAVQGGFQLLDQNTKVVRPIKGVFPVNVAVDGNHVEVFLDQKALGATSATGPTGTFSMVDTQGKILRLRPRAGAYAVAQSGQGSAERARASARPKPNFSRRWK
jgi:hypothetical protein